ncbi:MAG: leucine--tRNA ligase [Actinomycetes bacterium]
MTQETSGTVVGGSTEARVSDPPRHRYSAVIAHEIEPRWQARWEAEGTFHAANPTGPLADPERAALPRCVVLDFFPYPSGAGLHVGHPLGYIGTDVFSRYQRMTGHNVLHTIGFDAFGLPAEQFAVQTGTHPRVTTLANMEIIARQLRRMGMDHDPRRAVATIDPAYYRWTQWIFTTIYESWYDDRADAARPVAELVTAYRSGAVPTPDGRPWAGLSPEQQRAAVDGRRLAYLSEAAVNWCPGLGTVLANEEVTAEGRSERGNFPVFKRKLRQWMLRITAYADRLLSDLDRLDWPEPIKLQQRNWIGRSTGATVRFPTAVGDVEVFTTRPDTLFGATFMVLAPEHPLVTALTAATYPDDVRPGWTAGAATPRDAIDAYRAEAARKSEVERQTEHRDKTGVWTGSNATNPATGEAIPIFVADYVLMGYGTGAIMAVPGQDERDWEFAERFALPIVRTVAPPAGWVGEAYLGDGPAINSKNDEIDLDGLPVAEAKAGIIGWLDRTGQGTATVTYRLRDWLFSRQRYWGEPFPIVYDEDDVAHALPASMLPVELPDVDDYSPRTFDPNDAASDPEAPLARAREWVEVELDLGDGPSRYRRETNTMPNWAGSCWYELRYLDPTNDERFVDPEIERYWLGPQGGVHPGGVDLYVGGAEHAVLHLLYARFWHKVLHDLGHVSSEEPFYKLVNQGMIQAPAFTDERGAYVEAREVVERDGSFLHQGRPVTREFGKIGKSSRNMITPDDMCDEYGADTFRVYEMSMGPLDASRPWETRAVVGSYRFLQRVWRVIIDEATGELRSLSEHSDPQTQRLVHRTIDGVRTDFAHLRFNTAVAKLIELTNSLTRMPVVPREAAEMLVLMVAPLAPHIAEELWARLGHDESLGRGPFPTADPALLVEATVTCVVQVSGKVRDRLEVPPDVDQDTLRELALASSGVQRALDGRAIRTVVVRPPRLVNVVPA